MLNVECWGPQRILHSSFCILHSPSSDPPPHSHPSSFIPPPSSLIPAPSSLIPSLASRQPIACSDWSGPGDGDNDRGQIVTVCVQYAYQPILAGLLPIPDFTVSGRASLVVNH